MGKINWGQVFLCGLLTGGVGILFGVFLVFVGVLPWLEVSPRRLFPFVVIANFAMGIWTMWLYAAIRPRYGPGPKTAAVAGFAWWILYCLAKTNWGPVGLVDLDPMVFLTLLAAALPAAILAAVVGARYYKES